MSNAITFQPNRLSMRYSAEKQSEEDLIRSGNEIEYQEQNVSNGGSPENPKAGSRHERITEYKEDTCCDYMVNICHCTSWLCANLVSSIVLCFESCIDFVHTCKCTRSYCCDMCGGSEDSLDDSSKIADNGRFNDESVKYEDEHFSCHLRVPDIEENLPNSSVTATNKETFGIEGEELKSMTNNQKIPTIPDSVESSSL